MDAQQIAIVLVGALAGGLVNGLTGFGTGLTVLGIWLYAISPAVAATLVIFCSCISQLQMLPMIWPSIRWNNALAFIVCGLLGVPIGTLLLPHVDPHEFKIGIGVFLVAYTGYVLTRRVEFRSAWGGIAADCAVGFAGGVLGGLAGLSGVLLVIWTDIRGWTKDHRRGIIQIFNIVILLVALASHVISGLFTRQVVLASMAALPGTIAGAWLGGFVYRRIADRSYSRVIMTLLFISGVILIVTSR